MDDCPAFFGTMLRSLPALNIDNWSVADNGDGSYTVTINWLQPMDTAVVATDLFAVDLDGTDVSPLSASNYTWTNATRLGLLYTGLTAGASSFALAYDPSLGSLLTAGGATLPAFGPLTYNF